MIIHCIRIGSRFNPFLDTDHDQNMHASSFRPLRFKATRRCSNAGRRTAEKRQLDVVPGQFFKTSCRTFPDLVASHQEIRRKEQSRLVRGQRRNRIRQQQRDSTRVSRSPEIPSVQIAWKRALETDLSHRSDRFLWGIRHRFAGSMRRWIEVSLLVLVRRCCFRCLFHHGPQHRTQHMLR
jgi:hypothetical protein